MKRFIAGLLALTLALLPCMPAGASLGESVSAALSKTVAVPLTGVAATESTPSPTKLLDLTVNASGASDTVNSNNVSNTRALAVWAYGSDGLLREIATNTVATEYYSSAWYVRVEPASTNYALYSETLNNDTYWYPYGVGGGSPGEAVYGGGTYPGVTTAPDGSSTKPWWMWPDTSDTEHLLHPINLANVSEGDTLTYSVWLATTPPSAGNEGIADTLRFFTVMYDATESITVIGTYDQNFALPTTWERMGFTVTIPDTTPDTVEMFPIFMGLTDSGTSETWAGTDTAPWIYMAFPQLEKLAVASSYIPVSAGTPVARPKDVDSLALPAALGTALGASWTIAIQFRLTYAFAAIPNGTDITLLSVNADDDYLIKYQKTAGGVGQLVVYDGTNTATVGLEVEADTDYTVAAQGVVGSSLRIGYNSTWGTDAGAGAEPTSSAIFLGPNTDLPVLFKDVQAWDAKLTGNPSDAIQ